MQVELPTDFKEVVYRAAGRADVRGAVALVYQDLEREIAKQRWRCDASGRCCRFEEFGHRLFVTTIELATFVYDLETGFDETWSGSGCPFQIRGLCGVHTIRPFGCRVFFCDARASDWQRAQYERVHALLKRQHEELAVPYYYMEWRQALAAVGFARLLSSGSGFDTPGQEGRLFRVNRELHTQTSQQEGVS